ncbi:hypothetical protein EVA_20543 [gut metagenome]|uniref:Uncharacterized protein n=1 Tax=gut metagenome TaxID=749906 RepID=J9BUU4_9ZZZZ
MIDERCKCIEEKDCEHHTLRITRVPNPYSNSKGTYEKSINPFAAFSLCRSYRVSSHKYSSE